MRRSRSHFRPSTSARFLATIAIPVFVMVFFASPAFMPHPPQKIARKLSPQPAERADEIIRQSLFVDRAEEAGENPLTPRTPQVGDIPSYDIPKITPAVFDGDVRDLPYVPQKNKEFREPEEPTSKAKQRLSEALGPQQVAPNVPLAPMPGATQNFPGLSRTDTCTGGPCGAGIPPDTNGD